MKIFADSQIHSSVEYNFKKIMLRACFPDFRLKLRRIFKGVRIKGQVHSR